jgi:Ca2+-binding RTX toxin-like protein
MTDAISAILAAQAAALRQTVVTIDASVAPAGTASTTAIRKGTTKNDHFLGSKTKADRFDGGDGDDAIFGYGGNDELYGGNGNDVIDGGTGDDKLYGGTGKDYLTGGDGNDQLHGGSGDDVLLGGNGNDRLEGGSGNNIVYGQGGNDTLIGASTGAGTLDGGAGSDIVSIVAGNYTIVGGQGYDTLDLSLMQTNNGYAKNSGVMAVIDDSYLVGTDGNHNSIDGVEKIIGTDFDDTFYGGKWASFATDLFGGKGKDLMQFFEGRVNFNGGEGDDIYVWRSGADGVLNIEYTGGHDSLVIENTKFDPVKYSIEKIEKDIVISFKPTRYSLLDEDQIIIKNGADAYSKGLFGIIERTGDVPELTLKAVGGAVQMAGDPRMVGGAMNDTLSTHAHWGEYFNSGTNIMTGAGGADTFILNANGGTIRITDYNVAQRDKIKFNDSTGIQSFNQLLKNGVFDKDGFRISVTDAKIGETDIFLAGVDRAELTQAHNGGLLSF